VAPMHAFTSCTMDSLTEFIDRLVLHGTSKQDTSVGARGSTGSEIHPWGPGRLRIANYTGSTGRSSCIVEREWLRASTANITNGYMDAMDVTGELQNTEGRREESRPSSTSSSLGIANPELFLKPGVGWIQNPGYTHIVHYHMAARH